MKNLKLWRTGLLVGLFLSSCATAAPEKTTKPFTHYRPELDFQLGDKSYRGLAVTKILPGGALDIQITAPITLNRVEVSTCARHEVIRPEAKGWFGKIGKTMPYLYAPTGLELAGNCPLYIQVFNDSVQKAWGMIAIRTDQNLPGKMSCNGEDWSYSGISVCATKKGLESELNFTKAVDFEADPTCQITAGADKRKFTLRNNAIGWCKAVFSDGNDFHELILLGYDEVTVY